MVEAEGEISSEGSGTLQYGGKAGKATDYRIYTKYFNQNQMLGLTGQNGGDGFHMLRGGFRVDSALSSRDTLTVEGDIYIAREGELGFSFPSITSPALVPVAEEINLSGGFIQATWNHVYSTRSDSNGCRSSFIPYRRDDPLEPEKRDTLYIDYQNHIAWGRRQDIVWGLGYSRTTRYHWRESDGLLRAPTPGPSVIYDAFFQDANCVGAGSAISDGRRKVRSIIITQVSGVMPSISMTWAPSEHHMFWAAVSRGIADALAQ